MSPSCETDIIVEAASTILREKIYSIMNVRVLFSRSFSREHRIAFLHLHTKSGPVAEFGM